MGSPAARSPIITSHPIVDAVLDRYRPQLGDEYDAYRNHVLRGFNYQLRLLGGDSLPDSAALAWAIHDLGVWTAKTMDYLEPSAALADEFIDKFAIPDPDLVHRMVMDHHRIRPVQEDRLVETFRIADLVDASRGLLRNQIPRTTVHSVVAELPYEHFHRIVLTGIIRHTARHPLHPAPMLRW
ncbi:hypothetical protein [Nocardia sp. NPDC006630]|uniref:hypothetical protein n=1 Tax=Nocardia sp. NPDC006630 TaxID=3157181 RepID=UPI0033B27513